MPEVYACRVALGDVHHRHDSLCVLSPGPGIEAIPRLTASTPAQGSIGTVAGQAVAANADRKSLLIVNTGTTVLKITLGASTPTQTVYHCPLAACTTGDDGTGGAYFDDQWIGAVQIISDDAGGTYVLTEIE
jgi:hypothetical protein